MLITNQPHTIYNTVAAATVVADANNADSDGWEYVVVPDPKGSGRAIIKVYDEDGKFLDNL